MSADVEERRMAPQDAIGEEVLEVRKPSLTRRMSMEKRVVRRGSSHILIDVLSDSVEVEEIHDMTSSNDFSATSPRFSASSSSIAPSSSVKDHTGLLAEPNRPAHLDKHRITIAAVSPRLRRRPLNDKAARKSSMPDGGKQSSSEPSSEPPASSYYEPQLRCGVYSMQGRRKAMEDAHTIDLGSGSGSYAPRSASSSDGSSGGGNDVKESKPDHGHPSRAGVADELSNALNMPSSPDGLCAFFGVYDGHGGKRASDFASTILHHHILTNDHFHTDLKLAIREGFQRTEQEFLDIARKDNMGDGTTALIAFIKRARLYIGNIGDSEAVLSRNGTAVPLTTVHNPGKNPTEIERVKREGGRLYHDTRLAHPNLNPSFFNLGVSRSIGDLLFKHPDFTKGKPSGLTAEPDVVDVALEKTDQFIILACDGLWDVMDHQQAVDFVREALKQDDDPQVASKALGEEAYKKGSQDNITVVVCTLKEDLGEGSDEVEEPEQRGSDEVEEVRVVRAELKEDVPW